MQADRDRAEVSPSLRKKKWMSRRRGAFDLILLTLGMTQAMLHDLECEYQLSKKQQISNKPPIASATEEISVEPWHAENDNSGLATLAPSPNDIQILPESTATHLGGANLVSGNAGSGLQDMMFDRYAQNDFSAASMEWIGSDNLGAPFSVDMSNMNGLGMLPWSPPKNTYPEANFDIPYPIEHTTDASANLPSTSQFELNLPLSPTGPTRARYDEKMWEEVSSKIAIGNLPGTMSFGVGGEQYESTHSRWYWSDTALIEKCKSACFEEPLGISTFLTRSHFDNYVQQARESPSIEGVAEGDLSNKNGIKLSRRRAAIARHTPEDAAMTTISEQIDRKIYTELLSYAVSCARTRRFMNRDSVYMAMTKEKEYLARRSLWYLYSIEVVHSIRDGMPPILSRDWTDYALPEVSKDTDWLRIQCQYANALSSAVNTLYSQRALRQTVDERERTLMQAHKVLESWRTGLPTHLQNIHRHETGYLTLDDQKTRHLTLTMVHTYHEAIFIIFFPWTGSQSKGLVSEHYRKTIMELCVKSAQAVLAIASRISSCDILDGKLINLIAVSICVTFLDIVSTGSKKSLPYLTDALKLTQLAQKSGKP
ncbi:hypothetical protein N7481_002493 [Penicillium waksmanii]|uniref:uncharacterized protein n=1 Tax=Penicillium waksmanii TaxID=69791 RepID=UPI002546D4A0|nr:uncharacterized protein N7481_002493 [Penicillium waksmanii]KAJ5995516.1 hypothetical protein N7481_002493 [Penicillium waksmanii]